MHPTVYTDEELWESAREASLDRPDDPMLDAVESATRAYHRASAQLLRTHMEMVERRRDEASNNAFVIINGEPCDPALDLELAELDGKYQQAKAMLKAICHRQIAAIYAHFSHPNHVGTTVH